MINARPDRVKRFPGPLVNVQKFSPIGLQQLAGFYFASLVLQSGRSAVGCAKEGRKCCAAKEED